MSELFPDQEKTFQPEECMNITVFGSGPRADHMAMCLEFLGQYNVCRCIKFVDDAGSVGQHKHRAERFAYSNGGRPRHTCSGPDIQAAFSAHHFGDRRS